MSAHFPVVKLGYADGMTYCGMIPNEVANSIKFQLTSWNKIEVLACSFDTDFNYCLFDNALCNQEDGKCSDPLICWDFTVSKGFNFASLNSI